MAILELAFPSCTPLAHDARGRSVCDPEAIADQVNDIFGAPTLRNGGNDLEITKSLHGLSIRLGGRHAECVDARLGVGVGPEGNLNTVSHGDLVCFCEGQRRVAHGSAVHRKHGAGDRGSGIWPNSCRQIKTLSGEEPGDDRGGGVAEAEEGAWRSESGDRRISGGGSEGAQGCCAEAQRTH